MSKKEKFYLPKKYQMKNFPETSDFFILGFERTHPAHSIRCLCPDETDMRKCFDDFCERLSFAMKTKKYLPVLRIGDGELEFIFGRKWFNARESLQVNFLNFFRFLRHRMTSGRGLNAYTIGLYSSGVYSGSEVKKFKPCFIKEIESVMENGLVAFHLFFMKAPFSEQYFPILDKFLSTNSIRVTQQNVLPGYFVYALFATPRVKEIFLGKRIGVIHSAEGERRSSIESSIKNQLGVSNIHWTSISESRSFFDTIDVSEFSNCDAIFIGAGIGKTNIFSQLHEFGGPVLDLGYCFEAWDNFENRFKRVYCANDDDWMSRGVTNVFEEGI